MRARSSDHRPQLGPSLAAPPPGLTSPLETAIELQTKLLTELLSQPKKDYTTEKDILKEVPKGVREVFLKWHSSCKNLLSQLYNARELQEKYAALDKDKRLMKAFESEATRAWQWPRYFQSTAVLMDEAPGALTYLPENFEISAAWTALRRQHAEDCHRFIVCYNKQCTIRLSEVTKIEYQLGLVDSMLQSHMEQNQIYDLQYVKKYRLLAYHYVRMT